jgi:hypothetical protein
LFLHDKVKDYQPPKLMRKAVVHGHCHHKSQPHFEMEVDLLKKQALNATCPTPDAAEWQGLSVMRPIITKWGSIAASVSCSRLCVALQMTS